VYRYVQVNRQKNWKIETAALCCKTTEVSIGPSPKKMIRCSLSFPSIPIIISQNIPSHPINNPYLGGEVPSVIGFTTGPWVLIRCLAAGMAFVAIEARIYSSGL
jgi:hypothetical protein